ncbi:MAG: hypothetical protein A2Y24_07170 [Clostridiales bacterium GWE2_32_10]|nr:MAG: hypothetical protein A2Y24_07170 [Clostridiales bacterium GWE2_32_10]
MEIILKIVAINSIKENFKPSKSGFNGNRVFLSDNYVIKIFDNKDIVKYNNELLIYQNIHKNYIAKLINNGNIEGVNYLLLSRIKANTLYSIWDNLNEKVRNDIMKQILYIKMVILIIFCSMEK